MNHISKGSDYCSWNGFTVSSSCVALRTMSRTLLGSMTMAEKNYVYMYVQLGLHAVQWGEKKRIYRNKKKKEKYSRTYVLRVLF